MKNPTVATLLNFIPGLGYIYVGGKRRTVGVFLLIALILITVGTFFDPTATSSASESLRPVDIFYGVATIMYIIGFMYDGYIAAIQVNESAKKK